MITQYNSRTIVEHQLDYEKKILSEQVLVKITNFCSVMEQQKELKILPGRKDSMVYNIHCVRK